jgi:hypothetical protein
MPKHYAMDANGVNGTEQPTVIQNINSNFPTSNAPNYSPCVLVINAAAGGYDPVPGTNLVALQCQGSGTGPAIIGQTQDPLGGGLGGGVGVAGYSQITFSELPGPGQVGTPFSESFEETAKHGVAGVLGMCQAGPGVMGIGADAANPGGTAGFQFSTVAAGFGVLATGGASCAAIHIPPQGGDLPVNYVAQPPGAGLVALAGNPAIVPDQTITTGTGVFSLGTETANGFPAGRGGVFGSGGKPAPSGDWFSTSNLAQVQLLPSVDPNTVVPPAGRIGDLYVSFIQAKKVTSMYMCTADGDGINIAATWTLFQTSGSITAF